MALTTGLAGSWHFNGDPNDTSGSGNDASLSGAVYETSIQKLGSGCLSLDGIDDKGTVADDPSLDNADTIGFAGWFYITEVDRYHTIVSRENSSARGWYFAVTSDNVLEIAFDTDNGGSYQPDETFTGTTVLSINTWYHGAFIFDGGDVTSWLDRVVEKTGTTPEATLPLDPDPIKFGVRGNDGVPFKGLLDEFGYWTRALVQGDINELYNGGAGTEIGAIRKQMVLGDEPAIRLDRMKLGKGGITL